MAAPSAADELRGSKMRKRVTGILAVAAFAAFASAPAWAQVKSEHEGGMAKTTTSKITGEVVYVEGNYLIAKMQPGGQYRGFDVRPGVEFLVDGQKKKIETPAGDRAHRDHHHE
jgi:hypothetical protein